MPTFAAPSFETTMSEPSRMAFATVARTFASLTLSVTTRMPPTLFSSRRSLARGK
jgi:hypothetical protein